MRRITTTLSIFIFFLFTAAAQTAHPFELGFNGGAAWLKSDVKTGKLGSGVGLTFGQTYCMNKTSPLLWGWRFRYLNANTYGQDSKKSFGIANNEVLNGSDNDTLLDYYHNGGYVYHNYKTHIDELSLEILLGANGLRERTNLYPYIFAGAGLTKAVARINQLDDNSQKYDYVNKVDTTGSSGNTEVLTQLNNIKDGSYETLGDGNQHPKWKFMPSLGVGIGYEIIKGFSIGIEHKMTWALNDVLDAQQWSPSNSPTGTNDMYHYTSIWLKFSFGRGAKAQQTTNNTSTTTTTTPDVNTYTNTAAAPAVNFTNPAGSPFNTTTSNMNITGTVTNINSISDMTMTVNGNPVSGFTYNSGTHAFTYPAVLQNGANTFVITATNATGSNSATTTVIYSMPVVASESAPVVSITAPAANPYTTNTPSVTVNGTVLNISSRSQMQVMLNGANVSAFSYNASTHAFSTTQSLIQGANTFVISASNGAGNDSKTLTAIFRQEQVPVNPPPVVTIINPAANPYTTSVSPVTISASIQNITAPGQIQVLLNGGPVPASRITYNASAHTASLSPVLVPGTNTIEISATNVAGRDAKTETIIYAQPQVQSPPVVTITNPASNPFNTTVSSSIVNASVLNISSVGQISVTLNGGPVPTSALSYNPGSHQLALSVNLIQGANAIVVAATNVSGNDSKTETIIYTAPVVLQAPVVTITAPAANPFTTAMATASVNAGIQNITSAGQISVLLNGGPVAASQLNYNPATHVLMFNANLIVGANAIVVSATNASGSDSKTETVIYSQPAVVQPPVVTILNPTTNPFNTATSTAMVNASVLNITSAGQISVMLNGGPLPASALTYNTASHLLTFNANLIVGANTVVIAATNVSGNDSKTETIIYSQPVAVQPPVITITSPGTNPFISSATSATINATIQNISMASQINVTVNGTATGSFTFNPATQQLTMGVNLVAGLNTVVIGASNAGGADSKTQSINYKAPLPAPVVSFITPASGSTSVNTSTFAIVAKALNVMSSGQISVKVNGAAITAFTFQMMTKKITFTANLVEGNNTIVISANNVSGSDSKTANIIYTKPVVVDPVAPDTIANPGAGHVTHGNVHPVGTLHPDTLAQPGTGNTATGVTNAPQFEFVTPASATASTFDPVYTLTVKVVNVTNAGAISVKINGVVFPGFVFNNKTKFISIAAPLNMGLNTIEIQAANAGLSKTQVFTITRH